MRALPVLALLAVAGVSFFAGVILAPFHAMRIQLTQADRDEWHGSVFGGLRVAIRYWKSSWSWRFLLTFGLATASLLLVRLVLGEPKP